MNFLFLDLSHEVYNALNLHNQIQGYFFPSKRAAPIDTYLEKN